MNLIVVVDNNWGIGKDNCLLFKLPKDMAFFRQKTTGKVVFMGANTFASFPNGALPRRTNIVLDNTGANHNGAITVSNLTDLFALLKKYRSEDIFLIGGASVYKLLLPYCSHAYVTKVQARGNADVFFPNLDALSNWQCVEVSPDIEDNGNIINFCTYQNNEVQNY